MSQHWPGQASRRPAGRRKTPLRQRFTRWPLIARAGAIGCGGLIGLCLLALIVGLITYSLAPEKDREDVWEDRAVVVRIIDGDTVELDSGDTARVIGIDTPERGECGFDTASARMGELVQGKTVTLTRDGDDTDRYDRLLRYIDVDGTDAGLTLIEEGLATARYDSTDGYDFHTREPDYLTADSATSLQSCGAEQAPAPAPPPGEQAENCDPNYDPCVPVHPPDVNCGDLDFAVRVTGEDLHGLDADGDGRGCDSNG